MNKRKSISFLLFIAIAGLLLHGSIPHYHTNGHYHNGTYHHHHNDEIDIHNSGENDSPFDNHTSEFGKVALRSEKFIVAITAFFSLPDFLPAPAIIVPFLGKAVNSKVSFPPIDDWIYFAGNYLISFSLRGPPAIVA